VPNTSLWELELLLKHHHFAISKMAGLFKQNVYLKDNKNVIVGTSMKDTNRFLDVVHDEIFLK
jgi:hypothetical protein